MMDVYDVAFLARRFAFDASLLALAFTATFKPRATSLPSGLPVALTPAFANDAAKVSQWAGFARQSGAPDAGSLAKTVIEVAAFVEVPLAAARSGSSVASRWPAGGPWKPLVS